MALAFLMIFCNGFRWNHAVATVPLVSACSSYFCLYVIMISPRHVAVAHWFFVEISVPWNVAFICSIIFPSYFQRNHVVATVLLVSASFLLYTATISSWNVTMAKVLLGSASFYFYIVTILLIRRNHCTWFSISWKTWQLILYLEILMSTH